MRQFLMAKSHEVEKSMIVTDFDVKAVLRSLIAGFVLEAMFW